MVVGAEMTDAAGLDKFATDCDAPTDSRDVTAGAGMGLLLGDM